MSIIYHTFKLKNPDAFKNDFQKIMRGQQEICSIFDSCLLHVINNKINDVDKNHFIYFSIHEIVDDTDDSDQSSLLFSVKTTNKIEPMNDDQKMIQENIIKYIHFRVNTVNIPINPICDLKVSELKQLISQPAFTLLEYESPEATIASSDLPVNEDNSEQVENEENQSKLVKVLLGIGVVLLGPITYLVILPILLVLVPIATVLIILYLIYRQGVSDG